MKNKLLKSIFILLVIFMLTMPNYIMVASNLVTYAADVINEDVKTNNKNIEFSTYFKENGNTTNTVEKGIDADDISIFVKISVKNQGYFNGTVTIQNSNLIVKNNILSDKVNKIENNTITLNKINAGETCEIEIAVKAINSDTINASLLNNAMQISLDGTYRDSSEKDISISATKNLTLKLISSYSDDESVLDTKVITNKTYKVNGVDKKLIQVLVNSGINGYKYPISESTINVSIPDGVESVNVSSRGTYATNGKDETNFGQDNWKYDATNHLTTISLKNTADANGMISWKKDQDSLVVTMILDSKVSTDNMSFKINSQIKLYDEKSTTMQKETTLNLSKDVIDGIVSTSSINTENSIYKGKIYSGDKREYNQTTKIYIDYKDIINSINISEEQPIYLTANGTVASNIKYSSISINKNNMLNILGQDGYITIKDDKGNTIKVVNSTFQTDSNGNIKIDFDSLISGIKYETSKPVNTGILKIDSTKIIEEKLDSKTVNSLNSIEQTVKVNYTSDGNQVNDIVNKNNIGLNETTTRATVELNKEKLSTISENKNVEIKVVLDTSSEKYDLYKNPTLKIKLPNQMQQINVNSINLMYEDKMVISSAKMYQENDSKVIELKLTGEQTEYKDNFITAGTTIVINANITLNSEIATTESNVELDYTNEGATQLENNGVITAPIELEAPTGMITLNSLKDYNVSSIGQGEDQVATLDVGTKSKDTEVDIGIINNSGAIANNVNILGSFPVSSTQNNLNSKITKDITVNGIDASLVKIYYSTNENATSDLNSTDNNWSNSSTNAKKYLIVISTMQVSQKITAAYVIGIPQNIDYNVKAAESYSVTYNNLKTGFSDTANSSILTLSTGSGPEITAQLSATVGNDTLKAGDTVKAGEIIKYKVDLKNIGTLDATNVSLTLPVPAGTTLIKEVLVNTDQELPTEHFSESSDVSVSQNYNQIAVGQTAEYEYLVRVNKDITDNEQISNQANVSYNSLTAQSNELKNVLKTSDVRLTIFRTDDQKNDVKYGGGYNYEMVAENLTNSEEKNVTINLSSDSTLIQFGPISSDSDNGLNATNTYAKSVSYTIASIPAHSSVEISSIAAVAVNTESAEASIEINANATYNNNSYRANEITENLKGILVSTNMTSTNSNNYVSVGDIVKYTVNISNNGVSELDGLVIKDKLPVYLTIQSLTLDGKAINVSDTKNISLTENIAAGKTSTLIITAKITSGEAKETQLKNYAQLYDSNGILISETDSIINILKADTADYNTTVPVIDNDENGTANPGTKTPGSDTNSGNGTDNGGNTNNGGTNSSDTTNTNTFSISGLAWIDQNENGQFDSSEKVLSNIKVKLVNVATNKYATYNGNDIEATTDNNGDYTLSNIAPGKYIVVFMYDTNIYNLTKYQADGVLSNKNSDAMANVITIDGNQVNSGNTDVLTIDNSNLLDIDIGLVQAQNFDLKLDKYVSKIIVQNKQGTNEYDYSDKTLAKVELAAKYISGTTVLVEYKIVVTNNGDVSGYAKNIVDYMPADMKFSSELNKDWYQSGSNLYTTSLANTIIDPGKTAEVTLTLTKKMTEENTGLVENTAEIYQSYNKLGFKDSNSTEGNNTKGENDMGSADVIIGVKTGVVYIYLFSTLGVLCFITVIGIVTKRKMDKINKIKGGK